MAMPILPKNLRDKIFHLFEQGESTVEVFDSLFDEAKKYVDSNKQLARCMASIKGKHTRKSEAEKAKKPTKYLVPERKKFDTRPHLGVITRLNENTPGREFEELCH